MMVKRRGKVKSKIKGDPPTMDRDEFEQLELRERVALIQELIPIGLMAVAEELNREVEALVGGRYERGQGGASRPKRFGYNPGTVRLGGKLVPVRVPRVRSSDGEISLESYGLLHGHSELEAGSIFSKVARGISSRDIESVLPESASSIGASKSSVSRKVVTATGQLLSKFENRDLSEDNTIAIFLDGTSFASDQMIIALGISDTGNKKILGFVQTATENSRPIAEFLRSLLSRGLATPYGILAIIDGAKGLRKAVSDVFGNRVAVQRCQWHKRENVASYLPSSEQASMKKRLQSAYERPTYKEARSALKAIEKELETRNISALRSLEEGLEETLTLHRLGVMQELGISFKTTNCIESLNSMAKRYCSRVKNWKNSDHKRRWLAAALIDIEPRLNRVRGYKNIPKLINVLPKNDEYEKKL